MQIPHFREHHPLVVSSSYCENVVPVFNLPQNGSISLDDSRANTSVPSSGPGEAGLGDVGEEGTRQAR